MSNLVGTLIVESRGPATVEGILVGETDQFYILDVKAGRKAKERKLIMKDSVDVSFVGDVGSACVLSTYAETPEVTVFEGVTLESVLPIGAFVGSSPDFKKITIPCGLWKFVPADTEAAVETPASKKAVAKKTEPVPEVAKAADPQVTAPAPTKKPEPTPVATVPTPSTAVEEDFEDATSSSVDVTLPEAGQTVTVTRKDGKQYTGVVMKATKEIVGISTESGDKLKFKLSEVSWAIPTPDDDSDWDML